MFFRVVPARQCAAGSSAAASWARGPFAGPPSSLPSQPSPPPPPPPNVAPMPGEMSGADFERVARAAAAQAALADAEERAAAAAAELGGRAARHAAWAHSLPWWHHRRWSPNPITAKPQDMVLYYFFLALTPLMIYTLARAYWVGALPFALPINFSRQDKRLDEWLFGADPSAEDHRKRRAAGREAFFAEEFSSGRDGGSVGVSRGGEGGGVAVVVAVVSQDRFAGEVDWEAVAAEENGLKGRRIA